jgi:hypothetical protein
MAQALPIAKHRLVAGGVLALPVAGVIPGASALTVDVTAIAPSTAGSVRVFPGPCPAVLTTQPAVSSVTFAKGVTTANTVLVGVAAGQLCVYSSAATDLVVDVQAVHDGNGRDVLPRQPRRLIDTRSFGARTPLGAGSVLTTDLDGLLAVPAGASAAIVNLTSFATTASGSITASPCGGAIPVPSNVNAVAGSTVSNLAIVPVTGDHRICLSSKAATHLLVDLQGWIL